jgi:hypothetical protein
MFTDIAVDLLAQGFFGRLAQIEGAGPRGLR